MEIFSADRPLSVTALPETREESLSMVKYTMDMVQCRLCTHVYNKNFIEGTEMYHGAGCTMYNNGEGWQKHISQQQDLLSYRYHYSKVVEIGSGDGSFLAGLTQPNKLAYEPSDDYYACVAKRLETVKGYFDPAKDMPPPHSLIIMRHVLEHLKHPRAFIQEIVDNAQTVDMFIEVPCVENALKQKRVEDWVYEHPQHFTFKSLKYLMEALKWTVLSFNKVYGDEVLVYYGRFIKDGNRSLSQAVTFVKYQLNKIRANEQIVFWGGAGKSAMFLHEFSADGDLVVDSDERKFGKYVPGLGLEIRDPGTLVGTPTIVITTRWRADDILADIRSRGITPKVVYAYSDGELVEVYRKAENVEAK